MKSTKPKGVSEYERAQRAARVLLAMCAIIVCAVFSIVLNVVLLIRAGGQ